MQTERTGQLVSMLKQEPGDLFLNYALGLEYAKDLIAPADAESQFRIVLSIDSNYLAAYYQLGQLFEKLDRPSEALTFYKTGLTLAREQKNNKAINEFGEAVFMLED
jgi:tetratricopeptide (TPR) repeat protein